MNRPLTTQQTNRLEHEWAQLAEDYLSEMNPPLLAEYQADGTLATRCRTLAQNAVRWYQAELQRGTPPNQARELAQASLKPPPQLEDWEQEAWADSQTAAALSWLLHT